MHSFNLGLRVYYNILHLFLVVFLNVPSVFKPKLLFFLDVYFNIKLINIVKPLFIVFSICLILIIATLLNHK